MAGKMLEFDLLNSPLEGSNLIEASAGTGKTYTITGLLLRLVLERDIPINEILVVTYTEAATSELKDRVRRRLREAVEAFSGSETRDAFLLGLLEKYSDSAAAVRKLNYAINDFDQASIFTIHGFCLRTLLDHAFASGILFDTELVTDEEIFRRGIVQDFWRKHFYRASHLFFNYARSKGLNVDSLLRMAGSATGSPYIKVIPSSCISDCTDVEAEFRRRFEVVSRAWPQVREQVEEILGSHPALHRSSYPKRYIPTWMENMDGRLIGECLDCDLGDTFERFTEERIAASLKKGQSPPSHPFFRMCSDLLEVQQRLKAAYDERLLGLQVELFDFMRRELEARKRQKNILFFDDLLVKLERALAGPNGDHLSQIVRSRFKAALIDEFQDTDSIQYTIFEKVFGQAGSILFLIGDPKQAIYGFRGADIFTYMSASRKTSSRFTLSDNWRSEPNLISAVNAVFLNAEIPFVYDDISFVPATPPEGKEHRFLAVDGEGAPALQLWFLRSSELSAGKQIGKGMARSLIADAVAAEISRLLGMGREGRACIGGKPVGEGDIAVLVRRNREARLVQKSLSDLGIHAVLYSMGNLFETHEAAEVERVLAAVASPAEERLLRAALVTDMIGVSGEELDRLMQDDIGWDDWLVRFGEYHETWAKHGFFRMFRQLLSRQGVLPRLMSLVDGERRCTNILHLSEVLHRTAIEQNLNMFSLVKWLSAQRDDSTPRIEEHELRLESDENAVKLVTIHKSKGLEYPIVFCPFTWDGSRLKDPPFTFHDESTDGMSLTLDLGSPQRERSRMLAEREQLAENLRLLYVAMTRARHRCYIAWGRINEAGTSAPAYLLHLPAAENRDALLDSMASEFEETDDESMWKDLEEVRERARGAVGLYDMPVEKGEVQPPGSSEARELSCRGFEGRIDRSWRVSSFSALVFHQPHKAELADRDETLLPETTVETDFGDPDQAEGGAVDMHSFPRGAAAGILLHDIFEHLDFAVEDSGSTRELVSNKLSEHGFEPSWVDAVCGMVRNVLITPMESAFGEFILSRVSTSDRLNELEFYFPLRHLTGDRMREVLTRHVRGAGGMQGDGMGIPSNIERLRFEPLQGFMKGFIDLVFRVGSRYYILDWKSNYLGPRVDDYGQASLQKAMRDNFYNLQYYLYTVALHLYLKTRIPDYSYELHFGEVYYVFLRGVDPSSGVRCGIYRDRPSQDSIEALCENLVGGEDSWK